LFFSISVLICVVIMLSRSKSLTRVLASLYALIHICLSVYAWMRLDSTELEFFTFTGTGVLLLSVLSVLSIPVVYHGFIYAAGDDVRRFNIYHASLVALMTFMTGAYLANGMTVLWVLVEATTLAVALLINHDPTPAA